MNTKNASEHEIDVEVSVPKTSKAGHPIEMRVTLSNKGRMVPRYGSLGGRVECWAEVRDTKGKMAPPTVYGNNLFGLDGYVNRFSYSHVRLEPGTSKSWSFDLNRCYKFKTGDYKLSLKIDLEQPDSDKLLSIAVKDIPFKIE